MKFRLEERPQGWSQHAPIQIHAEVFLPAPPEQVFAVLADSQRWTTWFRGMRKVRIDGPATGVGARRTVWVGHTRVQEHFIVWQPNSQMILHIVESSAPGLRAMAENYVISAAPGGSTLSITVGVEAKGPLRFVPKIVRFVVGRLTIGAQGITTAFT